MLLGKRPRAPMKRTTSMSEMTFDLNTATEVDPNNNPSNQQRPAAGKVDSDHGPWSNSNQVTGAVAVAGAGGGGGGGFNFNGLDQSTSKGLLATVSPRNQRKHSLDLVGTPEFLRSCSLCKRPLVPGHDIYMYRGDSAFCSKECRQQQMNQDERKEKFSGASKKQVVAPPNNSGSQVTATNGETTVAAL